MNIAVLEDLIKKDDQSSKPVPVLKATGGEMRRFLLKARSLGFSVEDCQRLQSLYFRTHPPRFDEPRILEPGEKR